MKKVNKYYAHIIWDDNGTVMVIPGTLKSFEDRIGNRVKVGKCHQSTNYRNPVLFWTCEETINYRVAHSAAWSYIRAIRPDVDLPF